MEARRAIPSGRASFFATAVLAAVLPLLGAAPASGSVSAPAAVCGTWVLLQPTTAADLSNQRPDIEAALALPGVVGFSLRFTWKAVDTDFSLLEQGLAIARSKDKAFTIRPMAGRHTPARVFDAGSPFYTLSSGEKVPSPFSTNGSPNVVFEQAYDEFVGRLAAWSRTNGVRLLHLPWYGQDWAELNHGAEVRAAPGYSLNAWLGAHRRVIDIAARYSGPDLAVELPLTGYGPLANGPSAALADYLVSVVGPASERFFVQANGWGPNGDWGTTSATTEAQFDQIWQKPVRRGEQAIQAQDYDWTALFAMLYANDATYAEVYLPSFSLARKATLAAEIARFADTRCVAPAPVDSTPPTVAVDSPAPGAHVAGTLGVSITAADNPGPVAGVELLVDGAVAGSVAGPAATIAWDTTTAGDGAHVLGARATDAAGNTGVAPTVSVSVDNTAPAVPGGLSATGGDGEVTVAFEAVTAADLADYQVRTKPSASTQWATPLVVTSTSATFTGLQNGTSYDVSVRSRDDLGNASAWSASASAVPAPPPPDDPAPTVTIGAPTDGARVRGDVDVFIGAADGSGSVVEVELLVDGDPAGTAAAAPAMIPWDSTTVADGIHLLRARATDDAGNVGTSAALSLTVDNTAPAVPAGLSAAPGDRQVTVTFDAVNSADLDAYEVRMKPSSSATWGPPAATASPSWTFTSLVNGTNYDFSVRSRDDLGNTSAWSAAVSASPEAPPVTGPQVTITAPADGVRVAGTVDIALETSGGGAVTLLELSVDGVVVGSALASPATIPWDSTTLSDGARDLSARAVDDADNVGTSPEISVIVDNTAPAVPGGLSAAPDDGQVVVTFQAVNAADLAGYDGRMKPTSSSTWGAPVAVTSATDTFSGLTNDVSYDFSVRSRDTLGNDSAWAAAVSATPVAPVAPDTTAPVVEITAPSGGARLAGTVAVAIEASDAGSVVGLELLVDGHLVGSAGTVSATIGWDTTTVAGGVHSLSARAVDGAGNVGASSPLSVTVDNDPPGVPGGVVATPGAGEVTVTVQAVSASDLAGYDVRMKPTSSPTWGVPVAVTSATATFTGLTNEVSYDFSVRSRDTLGNASAWSTAVSATPVAPDTTAPTVAITSPAAGSWLGGTAGVAISASDAGSVVRVELLVDGQLVGSAAASSATVDWDTGTVVGGTHTLSARAVDEAGNVGTSASVSVTVDNDPPGVPSGLSATPGNGQVTVTFQAVSASDLAGYDVRMKPTSSSTWGTLVAATLTTATFTGLTNAVSYDFSVRSRDTLGNASTWSSAVSSTPVAPDTTAPTVAINAPAAGTRLGGTVGVAISASDAESVVRVELLVDGQLVGSAAAASATIDWETTTVVGGVHALSARAVDGAGNVGTSAPLSVTVDNDPPGVPGGLSATPGNGQVTVTFQAVSASDLAGYDVRMKPTSSSTWGAPTAVTSAAATFTGLTNGVSYDFSVRSRDTLGNASAWSGTISASPFVPDTAAPTVVITAPAAGTRLGGTVGVAISASDAGSVVRVELLVDGQLVGSAAASSATVNWNTTTVAAGTHTLSARAVDAAGNVGTSVSRSVTVDNNPPAVPGGLSTTPGNGQVIVTFQAVSASDLAGYDVRMKPTSSSTWGALMAVASVAATLTGLTNGVSYDFSVRSRDTLGNASAWSTAVSATPVAPDTTAPTVAITAPAAGTRLGGTVGVSISASDAGSVVRVELLVDGQLVGSAATSSATIAWDTRTVASGTHTLSARAVDAAGNVGTSVSRSVTVDNTPPAVPGGLIANPGDRQVTVAFQAVSAADLAGYDVRMKPTSSSTWGTPVAVTSATATFTGLSNGVSYDFSVRSRDTLGNASAWSTAASATPRVPDTQVPTTPSGLKTSSITSTSIQVCWNASTDNVGVAGYRVYRNSVLVATTTSLCQVIGNLTRNTSYTITVRAFDAAGNLSGSGSITARTRP